MGGIIQRIRRHLMPSMRTLATTAVVAMVVVLGYHKYVSTR